MTYLPGSKAEHVLLPFQIPRLDIKADDKDIVDNPQKGPEDKAGDVPAGEYYLLSLVYGLINKCV